MLNVVDIVKNSGNMLVEVNLGLIIVARDSGLVTTIKEPTYGRVIYPSSVSPFKFAVEPSWSLSGSPFILNSKEVLTPYHKVLSLSYSNMPVGNEKALIGSAKNVSPVDLHNVTILASVHRTREPRSIPLKVSYFMSLGQVKLQHLLLYLTQQSSQISRISVVQTLRLATIRH
jgi:hypothetical protein